jgi:hypothetical protein
MDPTDAHQMLAEVDACHISIRGQPTPLSCMCMSSCGVYYDVRAFYNSWMC